jgi:hypothetical protein
MFALDCFLKSLFIFVVFYLVVTTYKKYNNTSSTSLPPRIDDTETFGATTDDDAVEKEKVVVQEEETPQEPVPTGEGVVMNIDNIPSDPIEIIGDGTRMMYRGQQLQGQRQLIQLNSTQAIELKKKFDVKLIQDVVRFETGANVFVVYRALSNDDFLDYFIFWNNQTPFRLSRPDISSDPSRESNMPVREHTPITFVENVTYPNTLASLIQERAAAFQNHNTTIGPTAIDSKRFVN